MSERAIASSSCRVVADEFLRPWGFFVNLYRASGYQIKRLVVELGASLSLQSHNHRSECWIVVKGTAMVTCGTTRWMLGVGEAATIPVGVTHRLENFGRDRLEVVEVKLGEIIDEADITRYEDRYGRI